ncbi:MAG: PAS domain-containing protein, partial [Anaerolineaceae bacterium]
VSARGAVLQANHTAAQIMGIPLADLPGLLITDAPWTLMQEDGSPVDPSAHPVQMAFTSGQKITGQVFSLIDPNDAQTRWVESTALPVFEGGDQTASHVNWILADITAVSTTQKHIEKKLQQREKELQAFFAFSDLANAETLPLETLYQQIIEILPHSWQYPDCAYGRLRILDTEFRSEGYEDSPWRITVPIRRLGGNIGFVEIGYRKKCPPADENSFLTEGRRTLEAMAERIGHLIERRQASQLMQSRTDFLDLTIQATGLGKWQRDFKGDIFTLDDNAKLHWGFSTNVVPKAVIIERIHPDDRERVVQATRTAIQNEDLNPLTLEYRVIHPDGSTKWLSVSTKIQYGKTGDGYQPLTAVGTTKDITERKQI